MIPLPSFAPLILAAAIGAAAGYGLAAKLGAAQTAQVQAQLARCEQGRADDARAAAEATAAVLARAQDAEAQAARRLAAAEAATRKKIEETRRDVYPLTTGRECLSAAVRLRLNAAIAADRLPAGAGDAAFAASGSSADSILPSPAGRWAGGEGATDADVAGWALDAAALYGECRARIDAIREWDEVTHGR